MISQLLVALDGSPRAPTVFRAAMEIAERFDAVVHPFRAIFVPPEFPAAAAASGLDQLPEHMLKEALQDLVLLVKPSRGVEVRLPRVRLGQPWRVILEAGDELNVDLIVIGSHGYHGIDRLLGTTAARVANQSKRNVLVVHERVAIDVLSSFPPPSSDVS